MTQVLFLLQIIFVITFCAALDYRDVFFYKKESMTIKNIGKYSAQQASMQCAIKGFRWIAIMDQDINDKVQNYMQRNSISEAWLGLIQTMGGSARWIGLGESNENYANWALNHPQPGYVYMESRSGVWKSIFTMEEKTVLCMERKRFCDKGGRKIVYGDEKRFECEMCRCGERGLLTCTIQENCKPKKEKGCVYQNQIISEGGTIDMGCKRCTCIMENGRFDFKCTSCDLIDVTRGTAHETKYRLKQQCPPDYVKRGFAWVTCDEPNSTGCEQNCENPTDQCTRRCVPRCTCPPHRAVLSHGFCKPECPGRRFAPIIIEGLSSRVYPEGKEFTVRCTAIGEPSPLVTISEFDFEPDLDEQPTIGALGLSYKSKTYKAVSGVTPGKLTCYAWNINGVSTSSATLKVIVRDDTTANPVMSPDGEIRMPPMVRLGIENLVLSTKYGQRMRCVVTGAPKPEVIIVKLHEGSLLPTVKAFADPGIHDVIAEVIVMIDSENKAGRYACLAANKYGAVKDIVTLGFVEKAPSPAEAAMVMKAANFIKDPSVLADWPFEPQAQKKCRDAQGKTYDLYERWQKDCNTCTCLKDGKLFCTSKSCKKVECPHKGEVVSLGEVVSDVCNKCVCQSDGKMRCSEMKCEEDTDKESIKPSKIQCTWFGGAKYNVGEKFMHGCKKCYCHASGRPVCNDKSGCGKAETQCSYKDKVHSIGSIFRDNCQTCLCQNDGKVLCQGPKCTTNDGCIYKGVSYSLRDKFKDDCNMCMCLKGGLVMCSQNTCEEPKKPCTFQFQGVKHGTQKQVECNLCTCNDGDMTCTKNRCPGSDTDDSKEGCQLQGEFKKYRYGSVIQINKKLCRCEVDSKSKVNKNGKRAMKFVCDH